MTRTLLADLGGTRLKTSLRGGGDVSAVAHEGDWLPVLRAALTSAGADELALCVPGIVDGGRVVSLPDKLPGLVTADLEALLGCRVPLLVNDAIAYGVGESTRGAGQGHARVVVVTLGTGVGVAVVEDGAPLGAGPYGGGLLGGRIPLSGETFEQRCSASALVASVPGSLDVASAYALGPLDDYRSWLVQGLAALCAAHAPSCVVVGGGAAQPGLLDGVEPALSDLLWPGLRVAVRPASLGDGAALAGLEVLLRERVAA